MEVSFEIYGKAFNEYSEQDDKLNETIAADVILNFMQGEFEFPGCDAIVLQSKKLPETAIDVCA